MKRGKTRKNVNMYGGQRTPYSATAYNQEVLNRLIEFTAEINDLSTLATNYKNSTDLLNQSGQMSAHLTSANSIKARAQKAYDKAKEFWRSVYNTEWVPPPSPAPASGV